MSGCNFTPYMHTTICLTHPCNCRLILPLLRSHWFLLLMCLHPFNFCSFYRSCITLEKKGLMNRSEKDSSKPKFLPAQSSVALYSFFPCHLILQVHPLTSSGTVGCIIRLIGTTHTVWSTRKCTSAWVGWSVGIWNCKINCSRKVRTQWILRPVGSSCRVVRPTVVFYNDPPLPQTTTAT